MTNYLRAYSSWADVKMLPREQPRQQVHFPRSYEKEIGHIVTSTERTPIEMLLKFIHIKFADTGLQYTLIHRLFDSTDSQIAYYVPQLVYIAIRKPCKPMKKLLISRAKHNEALRRLILWNVKAFTVLMKEKDPAIKKAIDEFEESLVEHVKSKNTFNHALKAIAMLTQASLTLKKMPPSTLADKLKHFIKRFNTEFLNNVKHEIIIPFRQEASDKNINSNYVVGLVQEDCSCFPTRKRVPYRIIIETIDKKELECRDPDSKFGLGEKIPPEQERDLYDQVHVIVEKLFTQTELNIVYESFYPFVIDQEENKRNSQMKNFVSNLEKEEIKEQQFLTKSKIGVARRHTLYNNGDSSFNRRNSLARFKIKPNQNLKKFESIYIPNISSDSRRSQMITTQQQPFISTLGNSEFRRKSDKYDQQERKNVMLYQQQIKEWNYSSESIWGQAWDLKKVKYRQHSFFRQFESLRLRNVVVKGGDDLRQEIICMQLIYKMRDIVAEAGVDVLIKPYQIIVLSQNSGILEFVSNSISIDEMKKKSQSGNLTKFFTEIFSTQEKIRIAKQKFVTSLAGSSILTYVLKLRDRHNGNILLDIEGNIIHIDFGFILGMAPGNINFESSPFKLTAEYIQLIGGKKSPLYEQFCKSFWLGMAALRRRVDELTLILEIMMQDSDLDCFKEFKIQDFKKSFKIHMSEDQFEHYCYNLIERSYLNSRTVHYDTFQYYTNGILP